MPVQRDHDGSAFGASTVAGVAADALLTVNGVPSWGLGTAIAASFGPRAFVALRNEHLRRASVALKSAERISGNSREELDDMLTSSSDLVPMLTTLLLEIGNNRHDEVLKVLGAAYARALLDPLQANDQEMIVLALRNLTPEHVRVLTQIPRGPEEAVQFQDLADNRLALDRDLTMLLLADLNANGLVSVQPSGGMYMNMYSTTPLGRTVLEAFKEVNPDP